METTYTISDLHSKLASFEQELKEAPGRGFDSRQLHTLKAR